MISRLYFFRSTIVTLSLAMGSLFLPSLLCATEFEAKQIQVSQESSQSNNRESSSEVEEVIVTGTRLKNSSFSGVSPVLIINKETFELKGQMTAAEMIQGTSLATGSFQLNQQLGSTGPGGSVGAGGGGVNGISLRGLGTGRTLVILDGNRLAPAGVRSRVNAVDLNVLPAGAIDHTEIVKGGSSSIYGADAIAGVVNVITKKQYDGGSFFANGSHVVETGGGENYTLAADMGMTFDKGWLSFAGSYDQQKRLSLRHRDFLNCAEDYLFDPETGERADITVADGSFMCRNHSPNGAFFDASWFSGTFQPDPQGALIGAPGDEFTRSFLPDWVRVGNSRLDDTTEERESYSLRNEDSVAYQNADAISPVENLRLFLQGEYEFNNNLRAFGNFLYAKRSSEFDSWAFLFQFLSADNPNNTVAEGLQQASDNNATGAVRYQVARPFNASQEVNYINTTMGLAGTLSHWDWQITLGYGRSDGTYEQDFMYQDRLNAISQSDIACDPSQLNPLISPESTCDGINIPVLSTRFLAQDWTAEEQAFLEGRDRGATLYQQMIVEAIASGPIAELPAGTLEGVIGVSARRDEIDDQPGINSTEQNLHLFSSSEATQGEEDVREIFAELGIPVISDALWANDVSATVSARYTDYNISGSETTYKAGLKWNFSPAIGLRANYGTAFRGAALYELFLADQLGFETISDPCQEYAGSASEFVRANCAELGIDDDFIPEVSDTLVSSGGAILPDGTTSITPETSTSKSVGLVFTPENTGLSLAIEYYDIEINDEIDTLGVQRIIDACYEDPLGSNAFCGLVERNGANPENDGQSFIITSVNNRFRNIDSQINRGYDVTLNYDFNISSLNVSLGLDYNYELEDRVTRTLGDEVVVESVLGDPNEPQDSGNLNLTMDWNRWTYYYGLNYIGSSGLTKEFGGDVFEYGVGHNNESLRAELETGEFFYHSLSVSRYMAPFTLTLGVNNLLDQEPPRVSLDWRTYSERRVGTAAQNAWDLLGRRFFLTFKGSF